MGAYQSIPKTETEPLDVDDGHWLSVGANAMQGWRMTQEDAHNVILGFGGDKAKALFAVYDGHGGAEVAKYCADHFPDFLKRHSKFQAGDFENCLAPAFLEFDATLVNDDVVEELKKLAGSSDDEPLSDASKTMFSLLRKRMRTMKKQQGFIELDGDSDESDETGPAESEEDEEEESSEDAEMLSELYQEACAPLTDVLRKMSGNAEGSDSPGSSRTIDFIAQQGSADGSVKSSSSLGSSPASASLCSSDGPGSGSSSAGSSDAGKAPENPQASCPPPSSSSSSAPPEVSASQCASDGKKDEVAKDGKSVEVDGHEEPPEKLKLGDVIEDTEAKKKQEVEVGSVVKVAKEAENSCVEKEEAVKENGFMNGDVPAAGKVNGESSEDKLDGEIKPVEEVCEETVVVNGSNGKAPADSITDNERPGPSKSDPKGKAPLRSMQGHMGVVPRRQTSTDLADEEADVIYEQFFAKDLPEEDEDDDSDDNFVAEEVEDEDDEDDEEEEDEEGEEEDLEEEMMGEEVEGSSDEEVGEEEHEKLEMVEEEDEDEDDGILCDSDLFRSDSTPGQSSGCTAVVALLVGKRVYVANAGDSRCVLCRAGKAVDLSVDHKPEDAVEFARIKGAGGVVTPDGRVCGGLNLSRSFGDHSYKQNKKLPPESQMITANPDIRQAEIGPDDEFLILACDGIWNSYSSQEVVDAVRANLARTPKPALSTVCRDLFFTCLAPDTRGDGTGCDNMTAIIVEFGRPGDSKKEEAEKEEEKAVETIQKMEEEKEEEEGKAGTKRPLEEEKSEDAAAEGGSEPKKAKTDTETPE